MKFYRPGEIPSQGDELVCKATTTGSFIWPILYSGIAIALFLRGIEGGPIHGLRISTGAFCYTGAAVFGLMGWAAVGQSRARAKSTNWLMRCSSSGVLLKYRSFENWRFPAEDVQVVGFDYSEIAEIRTVSEKRYTRDYRGGGVYTYFTYLDICLANAETSALEAHLEAERKAEAPVRFKTKWFSESVTRWLDYPVQVLPGGIVRVRWKESAGYRNTPPLTKVIAYLGRYVKTTDSVAKNVDLTTARSLTPEEADGTILQLAQGGDKTGAVKLTRDIYGCSLSEAVAYVEGLQSKGRGITPTPEEKEPSPIDRIQ